MKERIQITKRDETKEPPVPDGVLPLKELIINTRLMAEAEEKRRLMEEGTQDFEKKIKDLFEKIEEK